MTAKMTTIAAPAVAAAISVVVGGGGGCVVVVSHSVHVVYIIISKTKNKKTNLRLEAHLRLEPAFVVIVGGDGVRVV
jgi:hypothetical protein